MIAVQEVSKFLGQKELFEKVSFHIQAGERIGLIGTNGAGKTTLLHILTGETEPDSGTVTKNKHTSIGYLPQQWNPGDERSVLTHAMDIDSRLNRLREELAELQQRMEAEPGSPRMQAMALHQAQLIEEQEHLAGYDLEARARKILAGLGFRDEQLSRPASTLSGGWAMRLALGRLLLAEPELLLLDEPTNHLDLDTLLWLEQYLISARSAMIVIAHDRAFLNRVVNRILELEQGTLQEYAGNYDYYLQEKAQRREIKEASYRNQQDRIRQLERFIDRNRYRKSTARRAQSRLKSLEKIDRIEAPTEQAAMHFAFPDPPRSGKRVMELQQVHKAYGDVKVYAGIDMVIERGERLAFLGPNGAGKSTLLKMLAGVESVTAGKRLVGHGAALGYYAQYQWEQLHPEWTILEEAMSVAGDLPQTRLRSLLGAFLFVGDDVTKKVLVLSGGEKARLILCKLLLQRPNVLLLDEPTNHLDIPSRDVLEKALREFPGTVCFISHDRHFIDAIANKVVVLDAGQIHFFPGNYSDYLAIWKERLEATAAGTGPEAGSAGEKRADPGTTRRGQEQKRLEAQWRNELYRFKKPLEKRLQRVDAVLETAHRELDALNGQLADQETYQDGHKVQQVQIQYQQCQEQIKDLTAEWEAIALELEELEENFWKDKTPGSGEGGSESCADGSRL